MPVYKNFNKDFFKVWTSEMAYALGLFSADGNFIKNKRGACYFSLEINDGNIIRKVKECLGSDHKIGVRVDKKSTKPRYRLQIGSREFYDDLRLLGFDKNKTFHLSVPLVPIEYFGDYVRGYFDGDGNVWVGFHNKHRKNSTKVIETAFTSCSLLFLNQLHIRLKNSGIVGGRIYNAKNGNFSRLMFSISDSLKLYEIMYNNTCPSLFLNRKKKVFEKYLKLRTDNALVV
ncbi:MAG: hypothetical protein Q8P86_04120 [bacterium]|nr:hypothetical protein [bacterium]